MIKIAHITDLHLDEKFHVEQGIEGRGNLSRILDDVQTKGITEVVFTGDIGTPESNQWVFDQLRNRGLNFQITLGNHDIYTDAVKALYPNILSWQDELYFAESIDGYRCIYLDTSKSIISSDQLEWLKEQLSDAAKILLYIHHPVLETGSAPQREYPLINSQLLKKVLIEHAHEVLIFCGHLHFDDEMTEGNITQYVTPAACFQAKRHSETTELDHLDFGYRILEIDRELFRTEVVMFDYH
ncbi:metallophosphoesterase [Crocinitomix catalasitica]|nr:metallophosphoesterase [Crocinitomix catalasitica]